MSEGSWRPASGYKTKSGLERWRVWNEAAPPHQAQLEDAAGRPRLFRTLTAARRVAENLNLSGRPDLTDTERRLYRGAAVMKTNSADAPRGAFWTFTDTGRTARADVVEGLIAKGVLRPRGDGLFGDSQTYALA